MSQILNDMNSVTSTFSKIPYLASKAYFIVFSFLLTTTAIGQEVVSSQINSAGCIFTGNFTIQINTTNPGNCNSIPLYSFTWNGTSYTMASTGSNGATECRQTTGNIPCTGGAGGTPSEVLPATVVITTGSMAGTYEFDAGGALPVELVDFNLKVVNDVVQLRWITASELDNKGFEIEHSIDGASWNAIGFVKGNGTTLLEQRYQFSHDAPLVGMNYYRLKQVDFDDKYAYSNIEAMLWQGSEDANNMQLTVLPNPATNWISFIIPPAIADSRNVNLEVYDQVGKLVLSRVLGADENPRIDIDNLPQGFYIMNVRKGRQQYSARFIKN